MSAGSLISVRIVIGVMLIGLAAIHAYIYVSLRRLNAVGMVVTRRYGSRADSAEQERQADLAALDYQARLVTRLRKWWPVPVGLFLAGMLLMVLGTLD